MKKIILSSILLFSIVVLQAQKANDVLGTWLTEEKRAKIEIYKEEGKYFGKIVWLMEPNEENGEPKLDKENPDPELKKRPILGLNLISGFKWDDDDDEWDKGEIYDPETGNTYSSYMKLEGDNKLNIRGYLGVSWIGRTTTWTRVSK